MRLAPRAPPIASPLRQGSLRNTIRHIPELQLSVSMSMWQVPLDIARMPLVATVRSSYQLSQA